MIVRYHMTRFDASLARDSVSSNCELRRCLATKPPKHEAAQRPFLWTFSDFVLSWQKEGRAVSVTKRAR